MDVLTGTPTLKANVNLSTGTVSGATVTVPAGTDDDYVHHYKITVKNETNGQINTYNFLSDFYRCATPDKMAATLQFPVDMTAGGKYTVDVVAVDSWDAESGKISCTLQVGDDVGELSGDLPEVYDDLDFTGTGIVSVKGKFTASLAGGAKVTEESLTFAGKTKTLSALKISAKGQYGLVKFKDYTASTVTNFYNSAKGFTVEAMFVNRAPSGSQGIVCCTQNPGGWGLAQKDGSPYFFTYVGSGSININAEKNSSTTELTHIVGTTLYDSAANKTYTALYINGELAKSGSYTGKVGVHSDASIATAFCLGADISGGGLGNDFQMSNFSITDVKFYASALNYKQVEAAYESAVAEFSK